MLVDFILFWQQVVAEGTGTTKHGIHDDMTTWLGLTAKIAYTERLHAGTLLRRKERTATVQAEKQME